MLDDLLFEESDKDLDGVDAKRLRIPVGKLGGYAHNGIGRTWLFSHMDGNWARIEKDQACP